MCQNSIEVQRVSAFEKLDFIWGICKSWLLGMPTHKVTHSRHTISPSGQMKLTSCLYPLTLQFNSVAQSCLTLCDPMNCTTPGLPVHHQLPESIQTQVRWVSDAIQPSHPLSSPSPPALNLSQHQSLFKWVSSSHQVAKVLEFQPQHQSFQWTPRTDVL